MGLKLMYITNRPDVARIAESAGVDRIFIDLETLGKEIRQPNMNTVKSHHVISDIGKVKASVNKAQILVRINHIHVKSKQEIDHVIDEKPDIIMLPYFKTVDEVKTFLNFVNRRVKTSLLVETPEAVECLDDILKLPGIDEIHIGLNDLSIGYHKKFMFENLADGTVEVICAKLRASGIPFGFGGIAALGQGLLPAEYIITEHYRLGSTCVILSRSFCNTEKITQLEEIRCIFEDGVRAIREYEKEVESHWMYFANNMCYVKTAVNQITGK